MSVVVWDGKTLAADMQATNNGLRIRCRKIKKVGDVIFACTGNADHFDELARWYVDGHKKEAFPEFQKTEDWSRLIVVDSGVCMFYGENPYPLVVLDKFAAWGSGRDFAYGALEMGADARKAVEVTIKHSVDCGFDVEAYDI